MPSAVGFGPALTQVLGNEWPEFEHPPTDRLIANRQSPLSHEILDVSIAQGELEVEPDSMSDDVGRKSVAGIINNGYG
jgi:hypothetical protein